MHYLIQKILPAKSILFAPKSVFFAQKSAVQANSLVAECADGNAHVPRLPVRRTGVPVAVVLRQQVHVVEDEALPGGGGGGVGEAVGFAEAHVQELAFNFCENKIISTFFRRFIYFLSSIFLGLLLLLLFIWLLLVFIYFLALRLASRKPTFKSLPLH
jgi:hypothetical protein